jgi:hypothetical protein
MSSKRAVAICCSKARIKGGGGDATAVVVGEEWAKLGVTVIMKEW